METATPVSTNNPASTFIPHPPKTLLQRIWKERISYLILLPVYLSYFVFFFYPVVFAFFASFARFDNFTWKPLPYIFYNYNRALFTDVRVLQTYWNVIRYVVLSLGFGQIASLSLALALNSIKKGVGFYRTLYYVPVVTSIVTIATIFKWLFGSDASGPVNQMIALIGIPPVRWLWDPTFVIPIISLIAIWGGLGFNTIIWMAGLKAIPTEYYEVATIDGASSWRQFWSITLPLLRPIILFQFVLGFIGGMKEFGLPFVLMGSGQTGDIRTARTPVLMVYEEGFQQMNMGYASALAYLLTLILIVVSIIQFRMYGRSESYD